MGPFEFATLERFRQVCDLLQVESITFYQNILFAGTSNCVPGMSSNQPFRVLMIGNKKQMSFNVF